MKLFLIVYCSIKDLPVLLGLLCKTIKEVDERQRGRREECYVVMGYRDAFIQTVKNTPFAI